MTKQEAIQKAIVLKGFSNHKITEIHPIDLYCVVEESMEQYANEQTISLIKAMKKGGKSYAQNINIWLKDNGINLKYDEI